jgi:hypothetical protein
MKSPARQGRVAVHGQIKKFGPPKAGAWEFP